VQPSGCSGNTVRTRPCYGSFQCYFGNAIQLTVRTLGQAVQTPSSILDITFYLNIGLGRNKRHWKTKKKLCNLNVWTAINSVRTERFARPDGPTENSIITFRTRKTWPVRTALAPVPTHVPQTPFFTRFWVSKAYK
jgi:hypothetical protein